MKSRSLAVLRSRILAQRLPLRQLSTTKPTASLAAPLSAPSQASHSSSASTSTSAFTTINASEISHFSRLSSEWWNPTGEFKLLHRMNPARVEYIRQKVALDTRDEKPWTFENRKDVTERGVGRWLAGKRCLDVGCGGGLLSESLARLGAEVVGVDASESNIKIANLHAAQDPFLPYNPPISTSTETAPASTPWFQRTAPAETTPSAGLSRTGSLQYRHTSAEALRDAGEKFDVVCAMEVVEHVDQPGEFMKCLGEMVKPGGHLIMSTISRTPLSQLLTLTLAEDVLRLVTPGTHTYNKFIRPEELRRFVHSDMGGTSTWYENLDASDVRRGEIGETRGIVYDPLKGEWRLWAGAEGTWGKGMGELCNYMYSARRRE